MPEPSRRRDDGGGEGEISFEEDRRLEEEARRLLALRGAHSTHPERYVLGKPHPDRAKQFKPFAALKGYEALVEEQLDLAAEDHDFSDLEEPC